MSEESIELKCPVCGGTHTYTLHVAYAVVHGFELRKRRVAAQSSERRFQRYFTCQNESGRFVATVVLPETARRAIEAVVVAEEDGG